jgi:hypothetical protein
MLSAPIKRPTVKEAIAINLARLDNKLRLGPGLPLRRFINFSLGTSITTRDGDLYTPTMGWVETTRRSSP